MHKKRETKQPQGITIQKLFVSFIYKNSNILILYKNAQLGHKIVPASTAREMGNVKQCASESDRWHME